MASSKGRNNEEERERETARNICRKIKLSNPLWCEHLCVGMYVNIWGSFDSIDVTQLNYIHIHFV